MHQSSTQFVRGGQATQHWLRMARQVALAAAGASIVVYGAVLGWLAFTSISATDVRIAWTYWLATYNVENRGRPDQPLQVPGPDGDQQTVPAGTIYTNEAYRRISEETEAKAGRHAVVAAWPALAVLGLSFAVFWVIGQRLKEEEFVRGARIVSQRELARWSRKRWRAHRRRFGRLKKGPIYTIAGIPFPPNAVEAQTGIVGTVGTGKTNAIHELLGTIRACGGRAIVYDRTGVFLRDHYRPETDIILNPFDARSAGWSPFNDADAPAAFAQMAEVLVPERPGDRDVFWSKSARIVFEYAARELLAAGKTTNAALREAILSMPGDDLAALIGETPGRHFFSSDARKTAASIRANMIAELRFLEFLRDDAPAFSITDWVRRDDPGFVFLTANAEQAAATRNIVSTIFELAANALMTEPQCHDPRIWFIIDEVPTLNRMPFLTRSLAEIRQYGGAFVLGYQVFSQLEELYGREGAQTVAAVLNNRVIFNTPDAATARRASESLGEEDVIETQENMSIGAHEARDGVGFVGRRTMRPIVTAAEIQTLPQFRAFLRFAYDAPTARVRFRLVTGTPVAEKFVPYTGAGFDIGAMQKGVAMLALGAGVAEGLSGFAALPAEAQAREFAQWKGRFPALPFDERTLWDHFCEGRLRGRTVAEIAPPDPSAFMIGNPRASRSDPRQSPLPFPGEGAAKPAAPKAPPDRGPAAASGKVSLSGQALARMRAMRTDRSAGPPGP